MASAGTGLANVRDAGQLLKFRQDWEGTTFGAGTLMSPPDRMRECIWPPRLGGLPFWPTMVTLVASPLVTKGGDVLGAAAEEIFRLPAALRSLESLHVASCLLETWKEHSSVGKTYTRCRITDEPPELPDGPYMVEFAHQSLRTNKYQGKWELTFLAPDVDISEAA